MSAEPTTPKGARWIIKSTLGCDDETAEAVRRNIGGILDHQPTRAFLAIAFHLANTTHPTKGTRDQTLINEGKRMAGLFIVQCAEAGLDLTLYSDPTE